MLHVHVACCMLHVACCMLHVAFIFCEDYAKQNINMDILTSIAANKLFVGISIFIMNIGSRFVIMEVGKTHEKLLSNDLVKKLVLFCMFFVATRDIMTSIILTFAFIVLMQGLLNENSRFNILPKYFKSAAEQLISGQATAPAVSEQEYRTAMSTIEKFYSQLPKNK